MSELALVMKTPVEQLIPAMLAWNNTELMAQVEATLKQYQGLTYTDEQMGEAKKDKAALNAFIKVLNDERIRIGKVYAAPYDRFKAEVDEVIAKVKETVGEIDAQVTAHDQAIKEKKQADILAYFESVIGEFAGLIPYERIHNPKWLNVSVRMPAVQADIDKVIEGARNAVVAIEALHSEDEETLKAYYFRNLDLGAALTENERLKQERACVAELKAKKEAEAKARAEAEAAAALEAAKTSPMVAPAEEAQPVAAPEAPKLIPLDFHVEVTLEQAKALQRFLVENNIKYSKI